MTASATRIALLAVAGVLALGIALVALDGPRAEGIGDPGASPHRAFAPLLNDSLASAFLGRVRGTGPVVCELAGRAVGGRWGHGRIDSGLHGLAARDPEAVTLVLWATSGDRDAGSVEPLRDGLVDSDACVRRTAARLLGRSRDPAAADALLAALASSDAGAREAGALGLGDRGERRAVGPLVAALDDPVPPVRATAAWALGRIESPEAIEPLARILAVDGVPEVRAAAARALGEIE